MPKKFFFVCGGLLMLALAYAAGCNSTSVAGSGDWVLDQGIKMNTRTGEAYVAGSGDWVLDQGIKMNTSTGEAYCLFNYDNGTKWWVQIGANQSEAMRNIELSRK